MPETAVVEQPARPRLRLRTAVGGRPLGASAGWANRGAGMEPPANPRRQMPGGVVHHARVKPVPEALSR